MISFSPMRTSYSKQNLHLPGNEAKMIDSADSAVKGLRRNPPEILTGELASHSEARRPPRPAPPVAGKLRRNYHDLSEAEGLCALATGYGALPDSVFIQVVGVSVGP